MALAYNTGYGIECTQGDRYFFWYAMYRHKKYANDSILRQFSKDRESLIPPDGNNCSRRAAELRRIKKKFNLKVVKVKMMRDYT